MNLEYFIAKRVSTAKDHKSSISAPIIKIAILAIAIGMIMMIVSVATGIGLQQKIQQKVAAFNGHITIANYDDNQSQISVVPIAKHQNFYPKFQSVEGISHIQVIANKAGIIKTATAFEGIIFKGVGNDYHWQNIEEYLIEGRLPIFNSTSSQEVLISKFLADRLNLKIGDKFNTFFMKSESNKLPNRRVFTIIGIFNSGFQEFDSTYIIGDIRHIQKINKWTPDQVGSFEVFLEDFNLIAQKGAEIYQETGATLDSQTIEEKYYFIFEWLKLFDFNIIVILIIMIAVATINMAVALLVLILERTQMIGMLKALGASNWSIRKIFLYNAFYIIARGLFWGNLIGIGLVKLQDYFGLIKLNPENYYVNEAPVYLNWGHVLALNGGTTMICLLILLIPSYLITKISPIKAIRYD